MNFDFLRDYPDFSTFADSAILAEQVYQMSPDLSCVQARKAAELAVKYVYEKDDRLELPIDDTLGSLTMNQVFIDLVDKNVLTRLEMIRKCGNRAIHTGERFSKEQAETCLLGLYTTVKWIAKTYKISNSIPAFDLRLLENPEGRQTPQKTVPLIKEEATVTPEMVNTVYGEDICDDSTPLSVLEELFKYADEGDYNLSKEQSDAINFDGNNLLIKGAAGSGKSLVLMKRAVKLYKDSVKRTGKPCRILILAFTKTLIGYIKRNIYSVLPDNNVTNIRIVHIDSFVTEVFKGVYGSLPYNGAKSVSDAQRDNFINDVLEDHRAEFGLNHRFFNFKIDFWKEEFKYIIGNDIKNLDEYKRSGRAGRGKAVRFSQDEYEKAYALYKAYAEKLVENQKYELLELYAKLDNIPDKITYKVKYDHVLVDEAQDLEYVKLKLAKLVSKKSITLSADRAQKLYSGNFTLRDLGIDIRGQSSKALHKAYRNSREISLFAKKLYEIIKANNGSVDEYTEPELSNHSGDKPRIIGCSSEGAEKEVLSNLLYQAVSNSNNTIGVLYRGRRQKAKLEEWLDEKDIDYEIITSNSERINNKRIQLCTIHSAKGLEFDEVIMPLFNRSVYPLEYTTKNVDEQTLKEIFEQERNVVYVGITRAKSKLYITYSGEPSDFIYEFEPERYDYYDENGNEIKDNLFKADDRDQRIASLQRGTKIFHKIYGEGTIMFANIENDKIAISYKDYGIKNYTLSDFVRDRDFKLENKE